ncbi:hypothetical protein [Synechococcus sp. GEYO]|nr:hypothetical protein [Synechococcus sp. GEYO]
MTGRLLPAGKAPMGSPPHRNSGHGNSPHRHGAIATELTEGSQC